MTPEWQAELAGTTCEVCGKLGVFYLDRRADGDRALCSDCYSNLNRIRLPMARRKREPAATAALLLAPVTLDPAPIAAQAKAQEDASKPLVEYMLSVQITTDEQARWAADAPTPENPRGGVISQLAAIEAQLEAMKDGFDAPAKAILEHSKACFGNPLKGIRAAIAHLKSEVKGHVDRGRAAYQAAIAAAAAAQSTPVIAATEVRAAVAAACPVPSGLGERESWGWKVVDPAAIPREYWVLDTARLDREAREHKGDFAVPGFAPVRDTIMVRS